MNTPMPQSMPPPPLLAVAVVEQRHRGLAEPCAHPAGQAPQQAHQRGPHAHRLHDQHGHRHLNLRCARMGAVAPHLRPEGLEGGGKGGEGVGEGGGVSACVPDGSLGCGSSKTGLNSRPVTKRACAYWRLAAAQPQPARQEVAAGRLRGGMPPISHAISHLTLSAAGVPILPPLLTCQAHHSPHACGLAWCAQARLASTSGARPQTGSLPCPACPPSTRLPLWARAWALWWWWPCSWFWRIERDGFEL